MNALAAAPVRPALDLVSAHRALSALNARRLEPRTPGRSAVDDEREVATATRTASLELQVLRVERQRVAHLATAVPTRPAAFVRWFEQLALTGPGQGDHLFPWLVEHATRGELLWFLAQEVAGEAGFEDLVAYAQVKLPPKAKLEMARNYWDEMGQGSEKGMHGGMLADLVAELGLDTIAHAPVWEAEALGNVMLAMASHRTWAFHAIGALGGIELTAPTRVGFVHDALRRHGISPRGRKYFAVHATLDVKHSAAWNREVLSSLVAGRPEVAQALAEGALMRLAAGERCFLRYRAELGVDGATRPLRDWSPTRAQVWRSA